MPDSGTVDADEIAKIERDAIAEVGAEHWRTIDSHLRAADGLNWHGGHDPELLQRDDGRLFWRVGPRDYIVDETERYGPLVREHTPPASVRVIGPDGELLNEMLLDPPSLN